MWIGLELTCCESTLLSEIKNPKIRRNDVAQTYRLALESSENRKIDWAKVNKAIMDRWSRSGLEWIKNRAWSAKCFKEEK